METAPKQPDNAREWTFIPSGNGFEIVTDYGKVSVEIVDTERQASQICDAHNTTLQPSPARPLVIEEIAREMDLRGDEIKHIKAGASWQIGDAWHQAARLLRLHAYHPLLHPNLSDKPRREKADCDEFICHRCGLRQDDTHPKGDF